MMKYDVIDGFCLLLIGYIMTYVTFFILCLPSYVLQATMCHTIRDLQTTVTEGMKSGASVYARKKADKASLAILDMSVVESESGSDDSDISEVACKSSGVFFPDEESHAPVIQNDTISDTPNVTKHNPDITPVIDHETPLEYGVKSKLRFDVK